jgi:GTP-binding protein
MADIPGIIEDAHKGKGLGLRFLRHIERNAVLLFVIPVTEANPASHYEILLSELSLYDSSLLDKPRLIAFSKADLLGPGMTVEREGKLASFVDDVPSCTISAVTGFGLEDLKRLLWAHIAPLQKTAIGEDG